MEQKGLRSGHFLALAGALAAFASLWRPWYEITIPQQLRDVLSGQIGQDPGLLGQMARGLAAALPSSISASGWKELQGADAAVAVGAVVVVALVLGAGGAFGSAVRIDPAAAARGIAAVGALGVVLALVHVVNRPGSGPGSDYVHVAQACGSRSAAASRSWPAACGPRSTPAARRREPLGLRAAADLVPAAGARAPAGLRAVAGRRGRLGPAAGRLSGAQPRSRAAAATRRTASASASALAALLTCPSAPVLRATPASSSSGMPETSSTPAAGRCSRT